MSDMCFDASERIARETDFRRAEIAAIDRFLANAVEFKLQDAKDCLKDTKLAESILDAYVGHKVVRKQVRFFCPTHKHTVLRRQKRRSGERKGFCHKCDAWLRVEGLDSESIFIRTKEPDRVLQSQENPTRQAQQESDKPTRMQRAVSFMGEHTVFAVRGVIILVCAGAILHFLTLPPNTDRNPTAYVGGTPPATPQSTATPMTANRATVTAIFAITPSA